MKQKTSIYTKPNTIDLSTVHRVTICRITLEQDRSINNFERAMSLNDLSGDILSFWTYKPKSMLWTTCPMSKDPYWLYVHAGCVCDGHPIATRDFIVSIIQHFINSMWDFQWVNVKKARLEKAATNIFTSFHIKNTPRCWLQWTATGMCCDTSTGELNRNAGGNGGGTFGTAPRHGRPFLQIEEHDNPCNTSQR